MRKYLNLEIISTGLAAFSMFFGAGNVVYPLTIGRLAGDNVLLALIGFLITAVGIPFLGLFAMSYFDGSYEDFFYRIGTIPGAIFIGVIMALIGPFAATPRLITVSHAALRMYMPGLSLFHFSLISGLIIYAFTAQKSKILNVLGNILSPILVVSLAIIIIKGLWFSSAIQSTVAAQEGMLLKGLSFGYNTLDLFAAIFFASVLLSLMKLKMDEKKKEVTNHTLALNTLKAGVIATVLLGTIYLGLGFVSAKFSGAFSGISDKELLSAISYQLLGPVGGIISSIAVALACLTTAITLATVFADFINEEVLPGKINYNISLIITLIITVIFANLGFEGIMDMLEPILGVIYPAVIVLTFCNILYKVKGIKTAKLPVFATLLIALIIQGNNLITKFAPKPCIPPAQETRE